MDAFNIPFSVTLRFFSDTDRHISYIYIYIYIYIYRVGQIRYTIYYIPTFGPPCVYIYIYVYINGVDVIVKNCIPTFIKLFSMTGLRNICGSKRTDVTKY